MQNKRSTHRWKGADIPCMEAELSRAPSFPPITWMVSMQSECMNWSRVKNEFWFSTTSPLHAFAGPPGLALHLYKCMLSPALPYPGMPQSLPPTYLSPVWRLHRVPGGIALASNRRMSLLWHWAGANCRKHALQHVCNSTHQWWASMHCSGLGLKSLLIQ